MTDRAGEARVPRTDAEVAERDVAVLQARLRAVEGEWAAQRAALERKNAALARPCIQCGYAPKIIKAALTPPPPAQEGT